MKHVNIDMLIHHATWLEEVASKVDKVFEEPAVVSHILEKVRVETLKHGIAYSQIRVDRVDDMLLLYFPGYSAMDGATSPIPAFKEGEKIILQNKQEKTIKEVVENFDASRLHHLEVRLQ